MITTMFPESKITEIYCITDDFCKKFVLQEEKYMIEDSSQKIRDGNTVFSDHLHQESSARNLYRNQFC